MAPRPIRSSFRTARMAYAPSPVPSRRSAVVPARITGRERTPGSSLGIVFLPVEQQNRQHYADPINCPVLAVGAQAYLGDEVSKQLAQVARDVRGAVIPASGHNIALENPAALAQAYLDFFAGG
jgi:pimeloyl-ACP methyl ester carboxylesterase